MRMRIYKYILALAFSSLSSFSLFSQIDTLGMISGQLGPSDDDISIVDTIRISTDVMVNHLFEIIEIANKYYVEEQYQEAIPYIVEADSIDKILSSPHITGLSLDLKSALSICLRNVGRYEDAANVIDTIIHHKEKVILGGGKTYEDRTINYEELICDYLNLALLSEINFDTNRAKIVLLSATQLMYENDVDDSTECAGELFGMLSDLFEDSIDLSISHLKKEYLVYEKKYGSESEQCRRVLWLLAIDYLRKGFEFEDRTDYRSALNCLKVCDSLFLFVGDDTSSFYFYNLQEQVKCQISIGAYAEALTIVQEAKPRVAQLMGENSQFYYFHDRLAQLYVLIKEKETSRLILEKFDLNKLDELNPDSIRAAVFCEIADAFIYGEKMDSAEMYYIKAIGDYQVSEGDSCVEMLKPLYGLAYLYKHTKDSSKLFQVAKLYKRVLLANTNAPNIDEYCFLNAAVAYWCKDYLTGNKWAHRGLELMEKNGESENAPLFYLKGLKVYAGGCFKSGLLPSYLQDKIIISDFLVYASFYSLLSEEERQNVLDEPWYQSVRDMVFSLTSDTSNMVNLYNYVLFTKKKTLNTDVEFRKKVNHSAVGQFKDYYIASRKQRNGHMVKDERKMRIDAARQGSLNWMSASYDSVRQSLGDRDIAVEYICYYDYRNLKNDSIAPNMYIALVTQKDWDSPIMIPLCNTSELTSLVSQKPDNIYRDGGFVSKEIIDLLVAPIIKYAKKGGKIYFSPDGVLYNIAIENMLTDDGQTLGQKYNLIRCSSTRNINEINRKPQFANAVLYGGLDYGEGITQVADIVTRKGWKYLPGTLKEVNSIRQILDRHDIQAVAMTENEGTEQSFMQLSGKGVSILHLATHGFFYTASSSQRETFFDNLRIFELLDMNINSKEDISPMQRSGLMLSNGNRVWMNEVEKAGDYDGVLLASEVLNMNLFGTELLVLSACETGLGDMSVEGIMGLQRAFKLAGVNTIVMSLWEVDDAATTLMMEQFYENLMSGKSKRESFSLAQQKVRKKYPEPQYWAAFIMLD